MPETLRRRSESLRFRPEMLAWWDRLRTVAKEPGRVHSWRPDPLPPADLAGMEQHQTATLVLCLHGTARVEDGRARCDLGAGDALLISPGTWHRHAAVRPGSVVYRQGVFCGRSDFFLEDGSTFVVATLPLEPSRALLARAAATAGEDGRRAALRELLAAATTQPAEPLAASHPALLPMQYALWENLHRPDALRRMLAASGLSRAQAYRVFQEAWGMGPAAALRRERLALARELLHAGLGPAAAASRTGFASRRAFTRAYRQQWGVAPSRTEGDPSAFRLPPSAFPSATPRPPASP